MEISYLTTKTSKSFKCRSFREIVCSFEQLCEKFKFWAKDIFSSIYLEREVRNFGAILEEFAGHSFYFVPV